jgi:superfamily II DNA/RNA helicase
MNQPTRSNLSENDLGSPELQERESAILAGLGPDAANTQTSQLIPLIRSGKDAFLHSVSGIESIVDAIFVDQSVRPGNGTSILVVETPSAVSAVTKALKNRGILGGAVAEPVEDSALLVGIGSEVCEFLAGDGGRATDIARVILVVSQPVTAEDVQPQRDILTTVCKRGKRPQLILLAPEISPALEELMQPYFQSSAVQIKHLFYEVGGELLAKGQALTDFIQGFNLPPTVVFCNQPSDADLVETILRKAAISSRKLVGHVSPQKIAQSVAQVSSGEVTALVVTDGTARSIEVGDFKLAINYSIPSDPEIYYHRTEPSRAASKLREVLNIVGPLDRANFFYLRKIVEASFEQAVIPSAEEIERAKFAGLKARLLSIPVTDTRSIGALRAVIEGDPQREEILNAAIQLAIQGLNTQSEGAEGADAGEEQDRRDRFPRHGEDRRGRDGRGQRGRDHREDRQPSQLRDSQPRESQPRDRHEHRQEKRERTNHKERGEHRERGGHRERPEGRERQENRERGEQHDQHSLRPRTIAQRSTRFYLGKGEGEGLTRDGVISILTSAGVPHEAILHVSMRKHFGFLDIDEKEAGKSLGSLEGHSFEGSPLFVKRAITMTSHVEVEEDAQSDEVAPIELGLSDTAPISEEGI